MLRCVNSSRRFDEPQCLHIQGQEVPCINIISRTKTYIYIQRRAGQIGGHISGLGLSGWYSWRSRHAGWLSFAYDTLIEGKRQSLAYRWHSINFNGYTGRRAKNNGDFIKIWIEAFTAWRPYNSWRMKDQLDVTCYFISLIMCSTCFGHFAGFSLQNEHHQIPAATKAPTHNELRTRRRMW